MRGPVQIVSFSCFLFSVTFVQGQECLGEDITYENTQPVVNVSYADGETVDVNCMTGYIGFYKLKCKNGQWLTFIARRCSKKKCGHPEETPNGYFKLIEGRDYTYGATVEYTCKTGYEMTSRINHRTCRAQGWDNAVPVCEGCLREDIKYENTEPVEKASYADGETVRVNCITGYTGLYRLNCEKGEWKKSIERPCAKRRCSHPGDTPNGDFKLIEGTEYVFGTTVVYNCKKGYEMASRINHRTCRAQGWDNAVPVCEGCLREDIKYENTEPVEKASYADGETVRVNCITGYTGLYRLKCEKGEWKKSIERPCAKRRCSHPGDTPNGDFKLIEGTEYVFGTTVVYNCKKGYEMASRINHRTCRAQGWDNVVPVCEEVTCELKSTTYGVKKIKPAGTTIFRAGESVEITCSEKHWFFGTKVTSRSFTCKDNGEWDYEPVCAEITCETPYDQHVYYPSYYFSGDKKLGAIKSYSCESGYRKTAEEVTCTRDGWTPKPLCAEIMCAVPKILNAETVGHWQPHYRINSRIQYKCHLGFEPEEPVQITCDSQGQWRGVQQCTEVTCQFESTIPGVKRINPEGKTVFKVGESVEIICSEKNLFFTKETSKSFTCQINGKWDSKPVCEITCEVPRDQRVSGPEYSFSGDMKLGAKRSYSCESGYRETAEEATCTRDGWTPKPLCAEMCAAPNIPNADIVRGQSQKYGVNSIIVFKCHPGFEPEELFEIICDYQGQWTGLHQQCAKSCRDLSVTNGFTGSQSSNKEAIFYSCNTGYKPFTGNWWDSVTCSKGSWSDEPRCIREEECGALPSVHHGKLKQTRRDRETAEVECDPGFISTEPFIKCTNGRWETPVCKEDVRCGIPPNVENAVITSKPEEFYPDGSSLTYICRSSYFISGERTVSCHNGTWGKTPTCQDEGQIPTCGPPPDVNDADTIEITRKEYNTGERVEYSCFNKFTLDLRQSFSKYLTCEQGEWRGKIRCLKPCTVTVEEMDRRGIELAHVNRQKMFAPHDDHINFMCKRGKVSVGSALRQQCNDGVMALPECVRQ
ncbi:complement factor H-like [Sinocyclocheilus grahami]|uniref:complement factor H-like n=1 Tax=Sinocyclocheilus grahami TaxID=75366 RepID=UPI0007AD2E9E|nr:PREDICTED: complement factor H-like [Sinocyclocheilus grahami]